MKALNNKLQGLTTCCKVLIIWIHSDCFCKQMLQILFLIKYQGLDSNVGPCQQKIAQILALGPNPTKGWLWMPEILQASLSCGQTIETSSYDAKSLDFGVFLRCQGGSAVQMAAWQQTCVRIEHDALQSGWRELLPHIIKIPWIFWGRSRSQSQVRSRRKNYDLSFHLNNTSFFLTTLGDFFLLSNGCAIVFR